MDFHPTSSRAQVQAVLAPPGSLARPRLLSNRLDWCNLSDAVNASQFHSHVVFYKAEEERPPSKLIVLNDEGLAAYRSGHLNEAEAKFKTCLNQAQEQRQYDDQATALANLAMVLADRGDVRGAESLHLRALELSKEHGPWPSIEARQFANLGILAMQRGEFARSRELLEQSLKLFETARSKEGIANTLLEIAKLNAAEGRGAEASAQMSESIRIATEAGLDAMAVHARMHRQLMEVSDRGQYESLVVGTGPSKLYVQSVQIEANRRGLLGRVLKWFKRKPSRSARRKWLQARQRLELKMLHAVQQIALGREPSIVEADIRAAYLSMPDSPRMLLVFATWLDLQGRNEEAAGILLEAAEKVTFDFDLECQLAWALIDSDTDLQLAEQLVRMLRANRPQQWELADTEAWLCYKRGNFQGALEVLEEALSFASLKPEVAFHAAAILAKLGREEEALKHLETALSDGRPFSGRARAKELREELSSA